MEIGVDNPIDSMIYMLRKKLGRVNRKMLLIKIIVVIGISLVGVLVWTLALRSNISIQLIAVVGASLGVFAAYKAVGRYDRLEVISQATTRRIKTLQRRKRTIRMQRLADVPFPRELFIELVLDYTGEHSENIDTKVYGETKPVDLVLVDSVISALPPVIYQGLEETGLSSLSVADLFDKKLEKSIAKKLEELIDYIGSNVGEGVVAMSWGPLLKPVNLKFLHAGIEVIKKEHL